MLEGREFPPHQSQEPVAIINQELASFSPSAADETSDQHPLASKTMIVVATKIDSANPEKLKKLSAHVKRKKLEFHAISAVTGAGIEELKWALAKHLRTSEVEA